MKLQLLLGFIILSMLIIPIYGQESPLQISIENKFCSNDYDGLQIQTSGISKGMATFSILLDFNILETVSYEFYDDDDYFNTQYFFPEAWINGTYTFKITDSTSTAQFEYEYLDDCFLPSDNIPTITNFNIDKSEYSHNEIVHINGTVNDIFDRVDLDFFVTSTFGLIIHGEDIIINDDLTFNYELKINESFFDIDGTYQITLEYEEEYDRKSITFEILPYNTQIEIDKFLYYPDEIISVSGIIDNFNGTSTLTWEIYDNNNILLDTNIYTVTSDTFDFTIPTTALTVTGFYDVLVTIQGETSNRVTIEYMDTPNMEPEVLYSMIELNTSTIITNDNNAMYMMYEYNGTMNIMNNTITSILSNFEILDEQFREFEKFAVRVNATLAEYPPVLTSQALNKMEGDMRKISDEIDKADDNISEKLVDLQEAIDSENITLEEQLRGDLGSLILNREMRQTELNGHDLYFELYPQNSTSQVDSHNHNSTTLVKSNHHSTD